MRVVLCCREEVREVEDLITISLCGDMDDLDIWISTQRRLRGQNISTMMDQKCCLPAHWEATTGSVKIPPAADSLASDSPLSHAWPGLVFRCHRLDFCCSFGLSVVVFDSRTIVTREEEQYRE